MAPCSTSPLHHLCYAKATLLRLDRVPSFVTKMWPCVQRHPSSKTQVNLPKPYSSLCKQSAMLLRQRLGISCTLTHLALIFDIFLSENFYFPVERNKRKPHVAFVLKRGNCLERPQSKLQVVKGIFSSSVHRFLLLHQLREVVARPAVEGDSLPVIPGCFSNWHLAHPTINQTGSAEEE